MVTHYVDEAVKLADRVLVMRNGVIAEGITIDVPHRRAGSTRRSRRRDAAFLRCLA